jgi:hypothetical protein
MSFVVRTRGVDRNTGIEEPGRTAAQHIRSSARGTCARPCDPSRSSATPRPYPRPRRPPVPLPPAAVAARVAGWHLPPGMTISPALLLTEPPAPVPRPTAAALHACGSPGFFRSCFVIVGTGGDESSSYSKISGDDIVDNSSGVSLSASTSASTRLHGRRGSDPDVVAASSSPRDKHENRRTCASASGSWARAVTVSATPAARSAWGTLAQT